MASTKLTKGYSTTGNRRTHTVSFWVKFCDTTTANTILNIGPFSGDQEYRLTRNASGTLEFYDYGSGAYRFRYRTHRLFRDNNAFYHIVCAVDTTQAAADERVKIYVNGVQETSFDVGTHPSQNFDTAWGIANNYTLAATESGNFLNGVLSHFHYADGSQLAPTVFGETDATTGEWKINTSPSFTPGTNGFTILKDSNTVTDQSSNSNNWTVSGTLTKTEDCPSNVFATWNGIAANLDTTLTNGNTKVAHGSQLERRPVISALGMSSGKYYAEFKALSGTGSNIEVGIVNRSDPTTQGRYMGQSLQDAGFIAYKFDGVITFDNTDTTGFTTTATNDILGVAVDIDNTRVYFYKNGTLINSGGTSFANMSGGDGDFFFCNGDRSGGSTYSLEANFGNGYFGTTAVSTPGTNASGIGIFEYDVPTGYTALSTKGLNL